MNQPNITTGQQIAADIISAATTAPTAENVELQTLYEKHLLSTRKTYPDVRYLLTIQGIPFLTVGGITLIQAQAKAGKTTLISILTAALYAGQWGPIARTQPDNKTIIFDTEQFVSDTNRLYHRIFQLSHTTPTDDYNRLLLFSLREQTFQERCKAVETIIRHEHPNLAIIDGIRDLVADINDSVQCPEYVQQLMRIASENDCALILVLHNNYNTDKARGWLGSEILNKCDAAIECRKTGNIVEYENTLYRHAPIPLWRITYLDDGTPTCEEETIANRLRENKKQQDRQTHLPNLTIIANILSEYGGKMLKSELVKQLDERGICKCTSAYNLIKTLTNLNLLTDQNKTITIPPTV